MIISFTRLKKSVGLHILGFKTVQVLNYVLEDVYKCNTKTFDRCCRNVWPTKQEICSLTSGV